MGGAAAISLFVEVMSCLKSSAIVRVLRPQVVKDQTHETLRAKKDEKATEIRICRMKYEHLSPLESTWHEKSLRVHTNIAWTCMIYFDAGVFAGHSEDARDRQGTLPIGYPS